MVLAVKLRDQEVLFPSTSCPDGKTGFPFYITIHTTFTWELCNCNTCHFYKVRTSTEMHLCDNSNKSTTRKEEFPWRRALGFITLLLGISSIWRTTNPFSPSSKFTTHHFVPFFPGTLVWEFPKETFKRSPPLLGLHTQLPSMHQVPPLGNHPVSKVGGYHL